MVGQHDYKRFRNVMSKLATIAVGPESTSGPVPSQSGLHIMVMVQSLHLDQFPHSLAYILWSRSRVYIWTSSLTVWPTYYGHGPESISGPVPSQSGLHIMLMVQSLHLDQFPHSLAYILCSWSRVYFPDSLT